MKRDSGDHVGMMLHGISSADRSSSLQHSPRLGVDDQPTTNESLVVLVELVVLWSCVGTRDQITLESP